MRATMQHPCPACCLQVLTKSLLPLPDKWHGLADVEQRYRKRWVGGQRSARVGRGGSGQRHTGCR